MHRVAPARELQRREPRAAAHLQHLRARSQAQGIDPSQRGLHPLAVDQPLEPALSVNFVPIRCTLAKIGIGQVLAWHESARHHRIFDPSPNFVHRIMSAILDRRRSRRSGNIPAAESA